MDNMPLMGLGTFIGIEADRIENPVLRHKATVDAISSALRIGYRHLDLAENYGNLPAVAEALRLAFTSIDEGGLGLTRNDIWLTMKANAPFNDAHIDQLLSQIGVTYFDLFLIHHPTSGGIFESDAALTNAWRDLSDIDLEKLHRIGVSNFYEPHLMRLLAICDREDLQKPYANEIEVNLWSKKQGVVTYCQDHDIHVIAYSPLGYHCSAPLLESTPLHQLAEAIHASPAQAALAWSMAKGVTVIPKSTHENRLAENFASRDYVHAAQIHVALTQALDQTDDMFPDGVTGGAESMKHHGENLDWNVSAHAAYRN